MKFSELLEKYLALREKQNPPGFVESYDWYEMQQLREGMDKLAPGDVVID